MKKKSKKLSTATIVALFICLGLVVGIGVFAKKKLPSFFNSVEQKTSAVINKDDDKSDVKEKKFTDKHLIQLEQLVKNDVNGKTALVYTPNQAINVVIDNDSSISKASKKLGVPKSFVQAVLLREISTTDELDKVGDSQVEAYFKDGSSQKDDSSTGLGQVFAKTAITSHNELVNRGLVSSKAVSEEDIQERKRVWYKLKDDNEYNITAVCEVLLAKACYKGLNKSLNSLNDEQKSSLFASYNGSGNEAEEYGKAALSYQKEFDAYNKWYKIS